jgi:hypothetical protein
MIFVFFILFIFLISGPQIVFLPLLLSIVPLLQLKDEDDIKTEKEQTYDNKPSKQPISFISQQKLAKNLQLLQGNKEGVAQLNLLMKKNNSFKAIISEINYSDETNLIQHKNTIDQLFLSVHYNLKQYYLIIKGIETIDYHHLKKRLQQKNNQDELNTEAIQQRLDLWETQKNLADDLFILNEIELTKIDLITVQVANLMSHPDSKAGGIEKMLITLDELSQKKGDAMNWMGEKISE